MSTDWNLYCVDCNDTHHFEGANHKEKLMWALIHHRKALELMAGFMDDPEVDAILSLGFYGNVNPNWFSRHKYHKLVPVNEYGGFNSEQCEYCRNRKQTRRVKVGYEQLGFYCDECCKIIIKYFQTWSLISSVIES